MATATQQEQTTDAHDWQDWTIDRLTDDLHVRQFCGEKNLDTAGAAWEYLQTAAGFPGTQREKLAAAFDRLWGDHPEFAPVQHANRSAAETAPQDGPLRIPVKFGNVSIGKTVVRLSFKFSRDVLALHRADEVFSFHRLTCLVILGNRNDQNGQQTMWDDMDVQVAAVCDVKGFRVTRTEFSTGLAFSLPDIDIEQVAEFSNKEGQLVVEQVVTIPEDDKQSSGEAQIDTSESDGEGDEWKLFALENLGLPPSTLKSLAENNPPLKTIGDLQKWTEEYQLTDVKGIGPAAAEKIELALEQFWEQRPEAEGDDEQETDTQPQRAKLLIDIPGMDMQAGTVHDIASWSDDGSYANVRTADGQVVAVKAEELEVVESECE